MSSAWLRQASFGRRYSTIQPGRKVGGGFALAIRVAHLIRKELERLELQAA